MIEGSVLLYKGTICIVERITYLFGGGGRDMETLFVRYTRTDGIHGKGVIFPGEDFSVLSSNL